MSENGSYWFLGLADNPKVHEDLVLKDHALHAIRSASKNTTLKTVFMYDGKDNEFLTLLDDTDAIVIKKKSRLTKDWTHKSDMWQAKASGAFLRLEVPMICDELDIKDDFVLYTDCDILFLKDPELTHIRPKYFAASTQGVKDKPLHELMADMNSGVMWMNVRNMGDTFDEFRKRCIDTDFKTTNFDQDIIRDHYFGKWDYLAEIYNWKTYWGYPKDAYIIHFHGPKVHLMEQMLHWESDSKEEWKIMIDEGHPVRREYTKTYEIKPEIFDLYFKLFPVKKNEELIKYYMDIYQLFD